MEMCVQVLHSGVAATGWGFPWCGGGSTRCGSNELWLEVVAEQVPSLLEGLRIPAPPSNKKENLCDWGVWCGSSAPSGGCSSTQSRDSALPHGWLLGWL